MAEIDPRLAAVARTVAARLELDRSLGVEHASFPRVTADRVFPDGIAALRESVPSDPWAAGVAAEASESAPSATLESFTSPDVHESAQEATPVSPMSSSTAPSAPSPKPRAPRGPTPVYVTIPAPPPESGEKAEALAPTRELACRCQLCGLAETRHHVVFGEGSLETDLVFVGEAPGRDEDEQGRPFVGRAGRLLTAMIENGLERPRASVYICNILKCRPPGNRDPNQDEVVSCVPYLHKQLEIIRPKVIVALGRIAGNILSEQTTSMGRLRGRWYTYRGLPLTAIYHPAYLLRQREACGGKSQADRETWEDLKGVRRKLAELTAGS